MDTTTLDLNMVTLLVAITGSWLTLVALIYRQSSRHEDSIKALDTEVTDSINTLDTKVTDSIKALDTKFTDKLEALDTKFTDKLEALDTKFTGKLDAMGSDVSDARERLVRVEEHLEDHGRRLGELGESSRERGRVLGEVRERLARVEGYLMTPEDFRRHRHRPPTGADLSSEGPDADQRKAG